MTPRTLSIPLLLALSACSDTYTPEPDPGFGELGVGVFLYRCIAAGDGHCGSSGIATQFPAAFAVGGKIHLEYDWKDDSEHFSDPLPQLQSASSALLVRENDGFRVVSAGHAAVLAVSGNNRIVDLRHLLLRPIDSLRVAEVDEPQDLPLTELELGPFDSTYLQAYALDADEVVLGGVLGYTWVSADPEIVRVAAGAETGYVKLEAVAKGSTTVTLNLGERSLAIAVSVDLEHDSSGSDGESGSTGDTDTSGSTGDTDTSGSTGDTDTSGSTGDTDSGSTGGAL